MNTSIIYYYTLPTCGFSIQSNSLVKNEELLIAFSLIIFLTIIFVAGKGPATIQFALKIYSMYVFTRYIVIANIFGSVDGAETAGLLEYSFARDKESTNTLSCKEYRQKKAYINSLIDRLSSLKNFCISNR